ncbi:MAG: hypothetical protein RMX68_009050 [Aulosira sp. ZfuVER01]|nr:hypothetical protein [Aulosira sp. ZfuVER01]MDZ7998699.1 hypothetical protein [Aulosira sp. DedVER01a]MDZ8054871.1 hypothetical protein [Aulosira sp. ZfuCHP01]
MANHSGDSKFRTAAKPVEIYFDDELHSKNFMQTLRMLEQLQPELFAGLILVSDTTWLIPGTTLRVIRLDDLIPKIIQMHSTLID